MSNNFSDYIKEYEDINKSYNNITIHNLVNKSYLIWNYHDFISLTNNSYQTINLFAGSFMAIGLYPKKVWFSFTLEIIWVLISIITLIKLSKK